MNEELQNVDFKPWFGAEPISRTLPDGRELELEFRMYNIKLSIRENKDSQFLDDSW